MRLFVYEGIPSEGFVFQEKADLIGYYYMEIGDKEYLLKDETSMVNGFLYEGSLEDMKKLTSKLYIYNKHILDVVTSTGKTVQAYVFIFDDLVRVG